MTCSGNNSQYYSDSWAKERWLETCKIQPPYGWSARGKKGNGAEAEALGVRDGNAHPFLHGLSGTIVQASSS